MKNRFFRASIYVLAAITILFAISFANAGDSTSFNPTAITVKVDAISGVPIGGVIPWPSSTPPKDYLECNGQSFSAASYPKLQKILGSTIVPDYRGEFLRGLDNRRGVDSGRTIGSSQGDAIRNITASANSYGLGHTNSYNVGGAFYVAGGAYGGSQGTSGRGLALRFDASRVVPTADENRPRNVAVMYIIRAK